MICPQVLTIFVLSDRHDFGIDKLPLFNFLFFFFFFFFSNLFAMREKTEYTIFLHVTESDGLRMK